MGDYATFGDPLRGEFVTDELSLRLCELLGIDPGQVTQIALTVEPGIGAVVRWDGMATVSLEDVSRALSPPKDPWEGEPPCGRKDAGIIPGTLVGPCIWTAGHTDPLSHRDANGVEWVAR